MENKINIAELLKDCPKGMELNCTMYDNCTFDRLEKYLYTIKVQTPDGLISLNKYGCYSSNKHAKCIIYPKGKTTWEGFVPPCEFKDGDIVSTTDGEWVGITTGGKIGKFIPTYCVIKGYGKFEAYLDKKETWYFQRLASEEEKAKLFQAIKDNGYYWNAETKTLKKLPKFKVGDKIKSVISSSYYTVVDIKNDQYFIKSDTEKYPYQVSFSNEINYKLVPDKFDIKTLKPFDSKVLVRHNEDNKWCASFFSHIDKDLHSNCYKFITIAGKSYPMMIPYEGNEHLLSTTTNCEDFYKTWEEK